MYLVIPLWFMVGASIQRFSILLLLFGGFLDLNGTISGYMGAPVYGFPLMIFALVLGLFGLVLEMRDEFS
ncbi:hypothetical protein [Haloarchaeobius baliensis]|uniref:hypothetical protein n=1 Tax=Haloarchaeobius baliensis TaxID=1670458 RepID=UPI003F8850DE